MNSLNQYLGTSEIMRLIQSVWSNIENGMLELIAGKMAAANVTLYQVRKIIEQVAASTSYRPGLKEFLPFLPRTRSSKPNVFFDLILPNGAMSDELGRYYQRARYHNCAELIRSYQWNEQEQLASQICRQLETMEKEKQARFSVNS